MKSHTDAGRPPYLIAFLLIPLIFGAISVKIGRDLNWDFKNYHYYNAYAFLEGRMDFDIAPAQLQTFINPLADLPVYWLAKTFPAWVSGFVFGAVHGLNLTFLLLIFWKLSNQTHRVNKLIAGLGLVAVSAVAPMFLSELGNTMHDNLTSVFVLGALLALLTALERMEAGQTRNALYFTGLAGLVMGLGVGLKPSIAVFALGSALTLLLIQHSWRQRLAGLAAYGLAGVAGGWITAGFWWLRMWERFRNPFFPFYNHLFKSPYFLTKEINWSQFLPDRWWKYLVWPYIFSLDGSRTNQIHFSDIRLALLYTLLLVWAGIAILRFLRLLPPAHVEVGLLFKGRPGNFLLVSSLICYLLWLSESATYRFLIPLELLTPLLFLLLLERMLSSRKAQTVIVLGALLLTAVFFRPFNWGRTAWTPSYVEVDTADLNMPEDSLVVMLGMAPFSFLIPEFPPETRFVRPEGNLFVNPRLGEGVLTSGDPSPFRVKIKNLLEERKEPFYILYSNYELEALRGVFDPEESLLALGINPNIEDCVQLKVNTPDRFQMCRVTRQGAPPVSPRKQSE